MCKEPKILFFDIETSPLLFWGFRTGKQFLSHEQIKDGSKTDIICICYKWEHEKQVHSLDWGYKKQSSAKMVGDFGKVVEKADLVVAHNGVKFDIKHINTQRLLHKQDPISWPVMEDTLSQFRKHFYFESYRLDAISKKLAGGGKDKMILQDWIDIVEKNNIKSFDKMIEYCKKDVALMAKDYDLAKSFFTPKINAGLIMDLGKGACPRCGSEEYYNNGTRYTLATRYRRRVCKGCRTSYKGEKL